jgi:hypothetical protein
MLKDPVKFFENSNGGLLMHSREEREEFHRPEIYFAPSRLRVRLLFMI